MRRQKLRESIEDFSFGVISTTVNLALSLAVFGSEFLTATSPGSVWRAAEASTRAPRIEKDALKGALWRAQNKGLLIRKSKRGKEYWEATEQAKARLRSELPLYFTHRPWDKRVYVILYDIPEEKRQDREQLRQMLRKIGSAPLQQSTYLMLWNPTALLREFISQRGLQGTLIVTDTGTDGSLGEKNLDELIWEVFNLEDLNQRYKTFLQESTVKTTRLDQLAFLYLSILKDDPQLPFELLPPTWTGDKAHEIFQKIISKQANIFFSERRPSI